MAEPEEELWSLEEQVTCLLDQTVGSSDSNHLGDGESDADQSDEEYLEEQHPDAPTVASLSKRIIEVRVARDLAQARLLRDQTQPRAPSLDDSDNQDVLLECEEFWDAESHESPPAPNELSQDEEWDQDLELQRLLDEDFPEGSPPWLVRALQKVLDNSDDIDLRVRLRVAQTAERGDVEFVATKLRIMTQEKYLGSLFSCNCSARPEVTARITKGNAAISQLSRVWRTGSLPLKTKIALFNAICVSIVLSSLRSGGQNAHHRQLGETRALAREASV